MSFAARVRRDGDEAVLIWSGELDAAGVEPARASVEELGLEGPDAPRSVVVDLGGLDFMDSVGIWLLVDVQRRGQESGVEVRLAGGEQAPVARTLSVSGVDSLLARGQASPSEPATVRLYVSSASGTAEPVLAALRAAAERSSRLEVEVVDVVREPERAAADRVIATPTVIRAAPAPERRLVGAVDDPAELLRHLGLDHLAA